MKLVELLYQNRDKFTLHDDCKWLSQDSNNLINMHTEFPFFNGKDYSSRNFIGYAGLEGKPALKVDICTDRSKPLSRSDYEQYCKEQGEKLVNDIDNALIKFKPFVSVEDNPALAEMPKPSGKGNPILGMVLTDLTNRAFEGVKKYGEPLKASNGRDALVDAYQEALDLCMYLRQAIEERNNG